MRCPPSRTDPGLLPNRRPAAASDFLAYQTSARDSTSSSSSPWRCISPRGTRPLIISIFASRSIPSNSSRLATSTTPRCPAFLRPRPGRRKLFTKWLLSPVVITRSKQSNHRRWSRFNFQLSVTQTRIGGVGEQQDQGAALPGPWLQRPGVLQTQDLPALQPAAQSVGEDHPMRLPTSRNSEQSPKETSGGSMLTGSRAHPPTRGGRRTPMRSQRVRIMDPALPSR